MTDAPFETLDPSSYNTYDLKKLQRELASTTGAIQSQTSAILNRLRNDLFNLNNSVQSRQLEFIQQQAAAKAKTEQDILTLRTATEQAEFAKRAEFEAEQANQKAQLEAENRRLEDAFRADQQQKKQAFERGLQTEKAQFEQRLDANKAKTAAAFDSAQDRVSDAIQVAKAPPEQREGLRRELERENRIDEAIAKAIAKLNLANQSFSPTQLLNLAQKTSGTTLERDPQRIGKTLEAIEDEQKKQQAEADRQARLAFEQELQARQSQFNTQQRNERLALETQIQGIMREFAASQHSDEIAFRAQLKATEVAIDAEIQVIRQAARVQERLETATFESQLQAERAAFNQVQRILDKQSADEVVRILQGAKARSTQRQADAEQRDIEQTAGNPKAFEERSRDVAALNGGGDIFAAIGVANLFIEKISDIFNNNPFSKALEGAQNRGYNEQLNKNQEQKPFYQDPNYLKKLTLNSPDVTGKLDTLIDQNKTLSSQLLTLANRPRTQTSNTYIATADQQNLLDNYAL
jgi:hypothetical protein